MKAGFGLRVCDPDQVLTPYSKGEHTASWPPLILLTSDQASMSSESTVIFGMAGAQQRYSAPRFMRPQVKWP